MNASTRYSCIEIRIRPLKNFERLRRDIVAARNRICDARDEAPASNPSGERGFLHAL